jgi:hypothetical protein
MEDERVNCGSEEEEADFKERTSGSDVGTEDDEDDRRGDGECGGEASVSFGDATPSVRVTRRGEEGTEEEEDGEEDDADKVRFIGRESADLVVVMSMEGGKMMPDLSAEPPPRTKTLFLSGFPWLL